MNQPPDYSDDWIDALTDTELQYWSMKPQVEKDWWAFNTVQVDRVSLLRTEIAATEFHKTLLDRSESEHQAVLDKLGRDADESNSWLKENYNRSESDFPP